MKTLSSITISMILLFFVFSTGCTKEPGPGGRAHVHGNVEYNEVHLANAFVYIWYDATSVSDHHSGWDDQAITNGHGEFEFEDLTKGDYYLYAEGDDLNGIEREGSTVVSVTKKSGEFETHIELE